MGPIELILFILSLLRPIIELIEQEWRARRAGSEKKTVALTRLGMSLDAAAATGVLGDKELHAAQRLAPLLVDTLVAGYNETGRFRHEA